MTKKDFERAAHIVRQAVRESRTVGEDEDGEPILDTIRANAMKKGFIELFSDSPNFDEKRFALACNPYRNNQE